MPSAMANGGSYWITSGQQDAANSGFAPRRWQQWIMGEDARSMQGSDEEAQGLLAYAGYAQQSMKGVADRAGGMIGGHMGFAMQAATISTQAWITFFVLLVLGGLLMAASFASLPMLLLAPQKKLAFLESPRAESRLQNCCMGNANDQGLRASLQQVLPVF